MAAIVSWAVIANNKNTNSQSNTSAAGTLSVMETNYDFGTISMKDGKVSHVFKVKNNSTQPVTIKKVYTSCMCTTATLTDSSGKELGSFSMPGHGGGSAKADVKVEAGHSLNVDAIFDPNAHGPSGTGLADRTVYLETNSKESPTIELNFRAMVTK